MKKCLSLLLMLSLLLGLVPALGEGAVSQREIFLKDEIERGESSVQSMVQLDDALYMLTDKALLRLKNGEARVETLGAGTFGWSLKKDKNAIHNLVVQDGQLYGFEAKTASLFKVSAKDGRVVLSDRVSVDCAPLVSEEDDDYVMNPEGCLLAGNRLFYATWNNEGQGLKLFAAPLDGSDAKPYEIPHLKGFFPYRDGKLGVITFDEQGYYDVKFDENNKGQDPPFPEIGILDPETGEIAPVMKLMADVEDMFSISRTFRYDEKSDQFYFVNKTTVYRADRDGATECAYLPERAQMGGLALLADGRYAVNCHNQLVRGTLDPEISKKMTRLTMAGWMDEELINRAAEKLGNVVVDIRQDYFNGDENALVNAMMTGDSGFDLLSLSSRYKPVRTLIDKGYLVPFTAGGAAEKGVQKMYDIVTKLAVKDGKAYCLPIQYDLSLPMVNLQLAKKLGLHPDGTLTGVFEDCAAFAKIADENQNVRVLEMNSVKEELFRPVVELYVAHLLQTGQELKFDTPLFRSLAEGIRNLSPRLDAQIDWENMSEEEEMEQLEKPSVYHFYYGFDPEHLYEEAEDSADESSYYSLRQMLLSVDRESRPAQPFYLDAVAVNAHSKNKELALQLVDLMYEELDAVRKTVLTPSMNEPVLNPWADRNIQNVRDYYEAVLKAVTEKKEKGEATEEDEKELARAKRNVDNAEKRYRYSLDEERIQRVREVMDAAVMPTFTENAAIGSENFSRLCNQYQEGAISLDQFVTQADQSISLMMREGQ